MSVSPDSSPVASRTLPTRPRCRLQAGGTKRCGPAGVAPLLRSPPAGPCYLALATKTLNSPVTMRLRQITLNQHREVSAVARCERSARPTVVGALRRGEECDDFRTCWGGSSVSIVRIGLAETKNFAEGYEAIFGKKKKEEAPKAEAAKKSKTRKKKGKKK